MKLLQGTCVAMARSSKEILMGQTVRSLSALILLCVVSLTAFALPDLIVSDIEIEPVNPQVGEPVVIEATILNQGNSAVHSPFFVHFFVDDREIAIRSIAGTIGSNRSKRVSVEWIAVAGRHDILIEADPPMERVEESNESNNSDSRTIHVDLDPAVQSAIGSISVVVPAFEDWTGSGFLHVGEGIADKFVERLAGMGIRVLERAELDDIMRSRALNPFSDSDLATAGRLLGADLVIAGSVTMLTVQDSSLQLGFLSVSGAEVNTQLSVRLLSTFTSETMGVVTGEGHDEGATGFSFDLGGLLSSLQTDTPDICGGGLQTARSWYNIGESVPLAFNNPAAPGWFSIEISTGVGTFVKWLGWQYVDTGGCGIWSWDQQNTVGTQMNPGIYAAKVWDGTAYIAEVSFQVQPGISLSIPSVTEITVGTEAFEETVVAKAINQAVDDVMGGLLGSLEAAAPALEEHETSMEFGASTGPLRQGQIATILLDGRIAVNVGASSGVSHGDIFEVLDTVDVIIDPQSLDILDYHVLGVKGEAMITEVRDLVSFAILVSEFEPVIGDIVRWPLP